jgi:hypothetical protein
MGGGGVKNWPVRKDGPLEIIPVDLVAEGILIVTAAVLCGKNKRVYHLASADQNPIMLPRLVAFLGMNSRYKHKAQEDGKPSGQCGKRMSNRSDHCGYASGAAIASRARCYARCADLRARRCWGRGESIRI